MRWTYAERIWLKEWKRKSWTSTKFKKSKRGALKGRDLQRLQNKQEESTEVEEMKQQQRMAIMRDLKKRNRSKGRMDAQNRWWVAELLAKDCEKAWTHTGWEDIMQKCTNGWNT